MSELTPEEKNKLKDESFARDFMLSETLKTEAIAKKSFTMPESKDPLQEEIDYAEEGLYDEFYQAQYEETPEE